MIRSAACVFFGILALLSQRRLFKYLKSRHNNVQLGVLNNVVRSRCRLNSLLFHVRFLEDCVDKSVAPKGIQRRVKKSNVCHCALIEQAFVNDELVKGRQALLDTRRNFQRLYQQAKGFLGFFDFIRFSWLLSECDRKQRTSLEVKNSRAIARLRQDRFGCRTNN